MSFVFHATEAAGEEPNMKEKDGYDALLEELEGIRDVYRLDVKQFVGFLRERKLMIVEGFRQYARWLDEEHDGKRYSPATVNRKLAASRSRVRYAFKHSAYADSLQKKYRLEDILKSVKLKKVGLIAVSPAAVLDLEEARRLALLAKSKGLKLMIAFLVRTGVRVSEMLHIRLDDVTPGPGQLSRVLVRGKAGKERIISVKKDFLKQITEHFQGRTFLFEHDGRTYNRVSVTNRIKLESLRILGREVSPRNLRNTWAATQIKNGRPLGAVAAALGHSRPGLTAQMYSPRREEMDEAGLDLEEAVRKDAGTEDGAAGKEETAS
jgi:integrase/recombinase XerD